MTTIAYRDGVLAGDTLVTSGGTKLPSRHRKVWKLRNGCLFAGAGGAEGIKVLKLSVLSAGDTPVLEGVEGILVRPDGRVMTYEGNVWDREDAPYYALGSGHAYAYTAMWCGHDAVKAVKAGIHFDTGSGGRVQYVTLEGKKQ